LWGYLRFRILDHLEEDRVTFCDHGSYHTDHDEKRPPDVVAYTKYCATDTTRLILLIIAARLEHRSIETNLIIGGDSARDTAHTRTADTLRSAHKKVLLRMAELLDGKTSAMTAIATRQDLCSTYVEISGEEPAVSSGSIG
jgi:hypothetical protein